MLPSEGVQVQVRYPCPHIAEGKSGYCQHCSGSEYVEEWVPLQQLIELMLDTPQPEGWLSGVKQDTSNILSHFHSTD